MRIAVLGMHRSGTSVLTRLLGFIGCYLGDADEFNPARPDNPAGDWERTDVWALNEDVLASLDATWCRVARFDLDRLDETMRTVFEDRARQIVSRLDARRPWAIKDPRLCLTLPVWRPALDPGVGVITHREPLAVAHSLQRRDAIPLAVGIALWEMHMLKALRHSRGLPRVGVAHRQLMSDPASTLRALRRELEDAGVQGLHDADESKVREFVDPSLVHGQVDPAEQAAHLNPSQQRLATALDDGSALSWNDVPPLSEGARDLLDGYFDLLDTRDRLRQDLATVTAERDQLAGQNAELKRHVEELGQRLEELGQRLEELGRRHEGLTRQHEVLSARYERDAAELIGRGTELQELIELVLASRRWRYGDQAGELLRKVMGRGAQPRAEEHAQRIVSSFRSTCREIANRNAEPKED